MRFYMGTDYGSKKQTTVTTGAGSNGSNSKKTPGATMYDALDEVGIGADYANGEAKNNNAPHFMGNTLSRMSHVSNPMLLEPTTSLGPAANPGDVSRITGQKSGALSARGL